MDAKEYVIEKIEGEYATLRSLSDEGEVFIAMALLPTGADVGVKLRCEMFEYSII